MKTKFLYTLVSSENDCYLEQAFLSMASLKYNNPEAKIILLVDQVTNSSFHDNRKKLLSYVDELKVIDVDRESSAFFRSRFIKTNARNLVEGDFLYIDSDTIITKSLNDIDQCQYEIAACQDSHVPFNLNPYKATCKKHAELLNWDLNDDVTYFNSGVIYVKDTQNTRDFYKLWHKEWLSGTKSKVFMDQPSFAKANHIMGDSIRMLDDIWNCELKYGMQFLKDAKIVHYLCSNKNIHSINNVFLLNDQNYFESIKKNCSITDNIKQLFTDPFKGIVSGTTLINNSVYSDSIVWYLLNNRGSIIYNIVNTLFKFLFALRRFFFKTYQ
ncbi:glycosyltransferase [Fibrobacter sp. UWEL]|uniref:glycosyltransferase n=1 Tax=Fibrobacter sp. UWEL TaxID=1896209 RepID=UPI00091A0F03|nr:glycosyltransferase [Fibrobacter sp. UWEL]SHL48490.1 Lipopolysaccharide biosynthesis protein, LPS:glycosyltransferase [Fibrobacter sp. UWEL]